MQDKSSTENMKKNKTVDGILANYGNRIYDDLFKSIRDTILVVNTERKIIDFNPAFTDLFGYKPDEVRGRETSFLYKDADEFRAMGRKIREGMGDPNFLYTIQYRKKSGECFPGETNVFYLKNNEGETEGFIGMIRDITGRLKDEEEVFESRERMRATLNSIGDGVITTDLGGRITGMNPVACKLTGWNSEDAVNRPFEKVFKIFNAITGEMAENPVRKVLDTGHVVGLANHTKLLSKDKKEIQIADSGSPIQDKEGNISGVVMVFRDVTDEYRMQEKLSLSEQKHRALVESVKAIVWEYDVISDRWTYVSPQAGEHTGWQPAEWTNLEFWTEKLHPADREKSLSYCFACAEKGEPHELEYRFRKKDGSYIWLRDVVTVEMLGERPSLMRGFIFDITARKIAEKELKEKTEFISKVMDNLPIGVAINKMHTGTAFYMNRMFERIYGWDSETIKDINTFFEKVYPDPEYREYLKKRITNDMSSGDPSRMRWEDIRITKSDGSQAYVNAANIPLAEQDIMVSTVIDISAQKRLLDTLIVAKEKAEEHDRLKSAFLANISHEIRTPMNGILGFTELLKSPGLSGSEQDHYIDIIQESGKRMLDTINDLIDISRIETGQMEKISSEVNLSELINSQIGFFTTQAKKKGLELKYTNKPGESPEIIFTDYSKLNSVLTNLIKNAIKFTEKGEIRISSGQEENFIRITVQDTGIGIPADQHDKIFDRFVQRDNSLSKKYEGSGIGLSIVKAYVKLLGGQISVSSEPGKGSSFSFTLPCHNCHEINNKYPLTAKPESAEITVNTPALKVLLADDDEASSRYLQVITREIASATLLAQTGREAVELCRKNPDTDLILMDIRMPDMDGYEATRKIRKFNKKVIIIAQTAHAMIEDREKAIECGCNNYIAKPLSKALLTELIESYALKA